MAGSAPAIIARGGFSGLLPDSSTLAYNFALVVGSPDTILWCDVQLTKDGIGICLPNLAMQNCTDISRLYPQGHKVYSVNGVQTTGWFPVDYNAAQLVNVSCKCALFSNKFTSNYCRLVFVLFFLTIFLMQAVVQGIFSRTDKFDSVFPILGVEDVVTQFQPPGYWLNVQVHK